MFLEIDQIARELDEIYLPLEQEGITGMRLSPQCGSSASMQATKKRKKLSASNFRLSFHG